MKYHYVPLRRFLIWLAAGWRFPLVVRPMLGWHGRYSCLMWRA